MKKHILFLLTFSLFTSQNSFGANEKINPPIEIKNNGIKYKFNSPSISPFGKLFRKRLVYLTIINETDKEISFSVKDPFKNIKTIDVKKWSLITESIVCALMGSIGAVNYTLIFSMLQYFLSNNFYGWNWWTYKFLPIGIASLSILVVILNIIDKKLNKSLYSDEPDKYILQKNQEITILKYISTKDLEKIKSGELVPELNIIK